MIKKSVQFLLALMLVIGVGVPAQAGLSEAHQQALAVYKEKKDVTQAIKLLEEAGVKSVVDKASGGESMKPATIHLLNDYAFFLSETADRHKEAIRIFHLVIAFDQQRHVAFLNLGDTYRKVWAATPDKQEKAELLGTVRTMYREYARLFAEKKLPGELPDRVREALELGKHQYEMVVSKDAQLCPAMLNLVNTDLNRIGYVAYRNHEEFTAIKWEPLERVLGGKFKDHGCGIYRVAKLDIDNDGRDDIVVKASGCLRGNLRDSLYIFDDDARFYSFTEWVDILEKFKATIADDYDFKDLPPTEYGGPAGIGGLLVLNLFKYQGRNLLTLTTDYGHGYGDWFAVSRYRGAKDMEDRCIFKMNYHAKSYATPHTKGQR